MSIGSIFASLKVPAAARCGLMALLALGVAGLAFEAQAADPVAGKALALRWCASCHLVAEDQNSAASVSLLSFYDIATDTAWTEDKLTTFLADPHPQMPNMSLGNHEIANLASYITSLQK